MVSFPRLTALWGSGQAPLVTSSGAPPTTHTESTPGQSVTLANMFAPNLNHLADFVQKVCIQPGYPQ
jgi:hypothetical protein